MTIQKRLIDIILASFLLIVLAPVILTICISIMIFDGFPIFYVSKRSKSINHTFNIIKFRTMTPDKNDYGASGGHKLSRVTKVGKFLRKTRLDEIPQLINIILSDMTFVGPRPPLKRYVDRFPEIYSEVLKSRPGVTGLASIYFHKHEEKILAQCASPEENELAYEKRCIPRKAKLDLLYQSRQTICFDILLMVKTIFR